MDDQLPHPGASSMACVIYGIFIKCKMARSWVSFNEIIETA